MSSKKRARQPIAPEHQKMMNEILDDSDDEQDKEAESKKRKMASEAMENLQAVDGEANDLETKTQWADDGDTVFEPFHMNEEREGGWFDKFGNYHRDDDKEAEPDNWVKSLNDDSHQKRDLGDQLTAFSDHILKQDQNAPSGDAMVADTDMGEGSSTPPPADQLALREVLLQLLKRGESVQSAIQRLAPASKSSKKQASASSSSSSRAKRSWELDSDDDSDDGNKGTSAQANNVSPADQFAKLSETAAALLEAGDFDVYSDTFERISRKINVEKREREIERRRQQEAEKARQKDENSTFWEYKWSADDDKTHGPFSSEDMAAWAEEGFFKNKVLARIVGAGNQWISSDEIDFDLL